ncbi:nitrate- and nitrite sensing domain-containing protein [Streptomyces sp. NPDC001941]|uniref:sensor histidine kinase n=1 Tax=Streptomyces sp. NPDC001941 TaxID=3154659 RepID=UPI00332BA372
MRVRSRLVVGVALVGLTVVAAGAPAVLAASAELNDAQNLVTLAELDRQAVSLAHSLADERDTVVRYVASGRTGKGLDASATARVDRQVEEVRAAAPDALRRELAKVPTLRRTALTGEGSALEAHRAYSAVIVALQAVAADLAERNPAGVAESGRAPAALGIAVEQASATRGLLLAALSARSGDDGGQDGSGQEGSGQDGAGQDGSGQNGSGQDGEVRGSSPGRLRDAATALAQQTRVRELAALADFDQAASPAARSSLSGTLSGPEIKTAEGYLARLTDQPRLSSGERDTDPARLNTALSARIEQMRGVEAALASGQVTQAAKLRDDDVTGLELRIALLGGCLLVAIGVSTAVARTLTRPLAVLRLGAARLAAEPEAEEPVRFTGRNDEFAQVVRSLNTLHGKLRDLSARAESLDADRDDQAGAREALAAELAEQARQARERTGQLATEVERLRHTVHHTFVNLSLRTLGLVERQLGVIERLEEKEQDPERLATLFKLDHLATVMRRHSENLLVLAGHEHVHGHPGPVPLVDVLRAAVSEIERYERVAIESLPPHAHVAGFAADDLSHLIAELLENATSFSPPDSKVRISGWLLEGGEVMVTLADDGIGMAAERLAELNARLADPDPDDHGGEGLGIRVTALLAARHGVRVQLREQQQGGVAAVLVLPKALLPAAPPTTLLPPVVTVPGAPPALNLPGSVAEANSNALPARTRGESESETTLQFRFPAPSAEERPAPAPEPEPSAVRDEPGSVRDEPAPAPVPEEPAGHGPVRDELVRDELVRDESVRHEPVGDEPVREEAASVAEPVHERPAEPGQEPPRTTDKGLPKRTPKNVRPAAAPVQRRGGVDAEALRRKLGGFQRGAEDGRRVAEREAGNTRSGGSTTTQTSGETAEEARS